jgi:hypothetical protein
VTEKPITSKEEQDIADGIDRALADPLPEEPTPQDLIFVTSTGAKIQPEPTDENVVRKIFAEFPEPDPPIITVKDGSREYDQENRDDPTYLDARIRTLTLRGEAMLKVYMLRCATILELPEGVKPFSHAKNAPWVEEYEAYGFSLPETKTARKLEWLRMKIFPRSDDLQKLQDRSNLLSGVREEDIAETLASFRDSSGRPVTDAVVEGV